MIDLKKAEDEFKKYTSNYDFNNSGISRKFGHSFRVMKFSNEIAKSLNLDEEEIKLATLIGLLHDIARFEEAKRFEVFSLKNKFDHGDYGVEILEKDNFIRKFIETDKYDYIIKKAIINHNKFKIEEGLDEKTLLHCKIIRDADKLDILYETIDMFWINEEEKIENSLISDSYYDQFLNKKQIFRVASQTPVDGVISCIAFIFDLNFKYSFIKLKEEKYIEKMLNRFNFKQEETIERIDKITKVAKEYINEKINS
jgi:putative nucleotidyltransferase with HDIG domain